MAPPPAGGRRSCIGAPLRPKKDADLPLRPWGAFLTGPLCSCLTGGNNPRGSVSYSLYVCWLQPGFIFQPPGGDITPTSLSRRGRRRRTEAARGEPKRRQRGRRSSVWWSRAEAAEPGPAADHGPQQADPGARPGSGTGPLQSSVALGVQQAAGGRSGREGRPPVLTALLRHWCASQMVPV